MSRWPLLALALLAGCSSRAETMRYAPGQIPGWVLREWSSAQDELLGLPGLRQDPRRFQAEEWSWIQMETEFMAVNPWGHGVWLRGATDIEGRQIIICCGDPRVVRHEAFHAILWRSGDPRYAMHYPELRRLMEAR